MNACPLSRHNDCISILSLLGTRTCTHTRTRTYMDTNTDRHAKTDRKRAKEAYTHAHTHTHSLTYMKTRLIKNLPKNYSCSRVTLQNPIKHHTCTHSCYQDCSYLIHAHERCSDLHTTTKGGDLSMAKNIKQQMICFTCAHMFLRYLFTRNTMHGTSLTR
jgi:hypothetical protein